MLKCRLLWVVLIASCGSDDDGIDEVIGAACASNDECATECFTGAIEFPDGFCSQPCESDLDCPTDTACIAAEGGVCAFLCPPFDCSRLGPGYECNGKPHIEGDTVEVCTGG